MDSTFIHYAILGILQGIFEWLPVSSQGIVALASKFLIEEFNPIDIALFLHIGTFFAVLIYFRKDWKEVAILKNPKLLRFLIITTIISLVIGYLLYKLVINIAVGNMFLVIMGFALLLTAYFQKKGKKLEIGFNKLAIITGFLQGLAVIPGFSRSGATIFGLSLGKLSPSEILKISYMMSVPVVLASSSYFFLTNSGLIFAAWPALVFSFLVGLGSLHFLITIANKIDFSKFALIFGLLCLLGAIVGFMV